MLNLNFSGYDEDAGFRVNATSFTTQQIQEILFHTSEVFAPFDVTVRRLLGKNNYAKSNGVTTIFVGDMPRYGVGAGNGTGGVTPWRHSDYPGYHVKGTSHRPNSDGYDLAFADPVSWNATTMRPEMQSSIASIVATIAHEAGHTFGLTHVLSNPYPETMSYNAANTRFINRIFNISNLNRTTTGVQPEYQIQPYWKQNIDPHPISTQNSFTYLRTVLGSRNTAGDFANVAHQNLVDGSYVDGALGTLHTGSTIDSKLDRVGDYDVFEFKPAISERVQFDVGAHGDSFVDTVLFIYRQNGGNLNLVQFNDDRQAGQRASRIAFQVTAGATYKVVVGSYNAAGTGAYRLTVTGENRKPDATTLRTPDGNTSNTKPTFTWDAAANASWYRLYVLNRDTNEVPIDKWVQATSYTPSAGLAEGDYTFWVQTWGNGEYGDWSVPKNFTVQLPKPGTSSLVAPTGTTNDLTPTFTWNTATNATWYRLYVYNQDANEVVIDQWVQGASYTPSANLAEGNYTAWVQTWGNGKYGDWSAPMNFAIV